MTQLENFKLMLQDSLNNDDINFYNDDLLNIYLNDASDIICTLRNSNIVETQYLNTQLKIAVELFNKRGAEGQTSHSENGIGRNYESANVSPSLLAEITPVMTTPFSTIRIINV